MKVRFFFLLCFLFAVTILNAQKDKWIVVEKGSQFLRFNFLGLLDPSDFNLTLGYEYRIGPNLSLAADAGWIFYSGYFENINGANGVIFRPAIRWFPRTERHFFMESELNFRHVVYKIEDWIGRDAVNNVQSYEEYTTFKYRKSFAGINLRMGHQGSFLGNEKLWYEAFAGMGIRKQIEEIPGEPRSIYTNDQGPFGRRQPGKRTVASISLGMRLLYKLK